MQISIPKTDFRLQKDSFLYPYQKSLFVCELAHMSLANVYCNSHDYSLQILYRGYSFSFCFSAWKHRSWTFGRSYTFSLANDIPLPLLERCALVGVLLLQPWKTHPNDIDPYWSSYRLLLYQTALSSSNRSFDHCFRRIHRGDLGDRCLHHLVPK